MKSRTQNSFQKSLDSKFGVGLPLTSKEEQIYDYIKGFISKNDYPPTYTEIQEKFGYKSVYSIQQFVDQLATKGYLKPSLGENKKRSLELVHSSSSSSEESQMVSIPLEGSVAAGRLTHSYQNRDYVEVPRQLLKDSAEYFSLRVKGDSMIEDCIMDGDLVIIKRQSNATNGQTVVALVGDEATIKRFYKKKDMIELHPANPAFNIIQVAPEADFKILGVLSSVIRTLE